jgi:long-chain acyl-CoA synthetase
MNAPGTVRSGERVQSMAEIAARGARAAAGLKALGVGEDDVVALLLRNDFAFFEAQQAAGLAGAYAVPINWHASADELDYILKDSGAKAVVAHAELWAEVAEGVTARPAVLTVPSPPEVLAAYGLEPASSLPGVQDWDVFLSGHEPVQGGRPADRGAMIYTSGTTGRPKGVRRRPFDPAQTARLWQGVAMAYGFTPDRPMVVLMTGPLYHSAPNSYATAALAMGAELILQPRFDAEELLRLVDRHRVTHMHIVPTMMHRLLKLPDEVKRRYDVSSLVEAVHGAAPCPPATKRAMIDWWGPVISEYYGSTETALVARLTATEALAKPGAVGRAVPGARIAVLDAEGRSLPPGEEGEVYVKADYMPDFTYHGREDARAEAGRGDLVSVGDIGRLDEDGFLYLSDRKRDMIISGGVNIYPAEIEAALHAVPGVRDCAVFGAPDPEFGEQVVAHIAPDPAGPTLDEAAVRGALASVLARYKLPKRIVFQDELPREDSGKIFKRKLREPYWAEAGRRI